MVSSTTNELAAARAALRDGGSLAGDAVTASAEGVVADWRKTECVIEGPDPRWNDNLYRIRHVPSNRVFGLIRGWMSSVMTAIGCGYYFDAPGTTDECAVDRVLAAIPDSARPAARAATANEEATKAAVRPAVVLGQGDYQVPWPAISAAVDGVAKVDDFEAIEKAVDDLADQFGLPKPPDGKGAPSAPSPFTDEFGVTFAPGMIVEPCLRPGDHYVVDLVTPDRMTVIPCGGGVVITVSPESLKFWRLSATRNAERPERDPEDIATQILALIEERTVNRVEVRRLLLSLLRCCAR